MPNSDFYSTYRLLDKAFQQLEMKGYSKPENRVGLLYFIDTEYFPLMILAADNKVSSYELDILEKITHERPTVEEIAKRIKEAEVVGANKGPLSVKYIQKILENKNDVGLQMFDNPIDIVQTYYDWFVNVGKEIIVADGHSDENEIKVYKEYIGKLESALQDEGFSVRNGIIEYKHLEGETANNLKKVENDGEESLQALLDQLNDLTGLDSVKNEVASLVNLIKIRKIREERGLPQPPMSLHLVFTGNPGTGKTTVARLISQIYHSLGILSKGHLVESDRSDLVAGYVGQTAIKTKEKLDEAMGGVLFIDEAYTLKKGGSNDYGQEAIDTILKVMEDKRDDFVVIVAGYEDLMEEFINSNPGLKSRFNKYILFVDYTDKQLLDIFKSFCKKSGLTTTEDGDKTLLSHFTNMCMNKKENFANGRDVRNIFEKTLLQQADRLALKENISDADLITITYEDIVNSL